MTPIYLFLRMSDTIMLIAKKKKRMKKENENMFRCFLNDKNRASLKENLSPFGSSIDNKNADTNFLELAQYHFMN